MALADAIKAGAASGKPVRPPNLGVALPQSKRMCAACRYYRSGGLKGGACRLYGGYPVRANQVSDSFRPR